jgi:hypothetical protein
MTPTAQIGSSDKLAKACGTRRGEPLQGAGASLDPLVANLQREHSRHDEDGLVLPTVDVSPWSRSVCRHPGLPEGDQPSGAVATRQHGPRLRLVYSNKGEGFEGSHLRLLGLHPPPSPQPAASPWIERQGSDGCLADPPRPGHLRRIHPGSWLESQPISEVGFANYRRAADQGSTFLIARRRRRGVATPRPPTCQHGWSL